MKAVIDIGTNTFHLVIADVEGHTVNYIHKQTIAVKLGEGGGISKGEIIPTAYQRGLEAMQTFHEEIKKHDVKTVKATATAAVRDAANGAAFINEVDQLTQIPIEVIDGLKEATYIYQGAKASGALTEDTALIMDIGGGSVEFILANQHQIFWKNSYRLGAARLLNEFYLSDPLSETDKNALFKHFNVTLPDLFEAIQIHQPKKLIGTAGAFDSYKEIFCVRNKDDASPIVYPLPGADFECLLQEIIASSHEQRSNIKGLVPLRTDLILMASMLTSYILKNSPDIKESLCCAYALKEGLLFGDEVAEI